ncbi:MAG: hypothetical protein ABI921_00665, partial [Panacibacter sp.]
MKTFTLSLLLLLVTVLQLKAQTVEERLSQKKPTCREILMNAATVLPDLYTQRNFDSLATAIDFIEGSCPGMHQVFYLKTLLHIERPSILMPETIDSNFIDYLNSYALMLPMMKSRGLQFYNAEEYKLVI